MHIYLMVCSHYEALNRQIVYINKTLLFILSHYSFNGRACWYESIILLNLHAHNMIIIVVDFDVTVNNPSSTYTREFVANLLDVVQQICHCLDTHTWKCPYPWLDSKHWWRSVFDWSVIVGAT